MLKASFVIDIARRPIEVWRVLSNHENDLKWQSVVAEVRKLSPGLVRAGSRFRHTLQMMGVRMEAEVRIAETRPGELHVFAVSGGPFAFTTRVALRPSSSGTLVQTDIEGEPTSMGRLTAITLSRLRRREIQQDLERLKRLMEAGHL